MDITASVLALPLGLVLSSSPLLIPHREVTDKAETAYLVQFEHALSNKKEEALTDVHVFLPVPVTEVGQRVVDLIWNVDGSPVEPAFRTDQFGQIFAVLKLAHIEALGTASVGWTAEVFLQNRQAVPLDEDSVGSLADIPEEVRALFLEDEPSMFDMSSEVVARAATDLARDNLLAEVTAIHDYVAGSIEYKREGGWDAASKVIERGTGSCSEYSYTFSALCRSRGLPTRLVGGSSCRKRPTAEKPYVDTTWHRWIEVYLPPWGWVAFDPTRDRGTPPGRKRFGRGVISGLIISRSGGRSNLMGSHYLGGNTHWKSLSRKRSFTYTLLAPGDDNSAGTHH